MGRANSPEVYLASACPVSKSYNTPFRGRLLCRAQTCIGRLDSWPSRPRKALAPQAVPSEPSCLLVTGTEEGRNGELKCMCRSPGMRCSLQGAIEQKNNWVAGAQSQNGKPSALSEDAARHSTRSQRPGSARREPPKCEASQHDTALLLSGVKIASASATVLNPLPPDQAQTVGRW